MLTVDISKDLKQLERQIVALKWQVQHDTNDKDKQIHIKALEELKQAYGKGF